ncbi:MAG: hypothetical protein QM495_08885 [Lutibacter sp.]
MNVSLFGFNPDNVCFNSISNLSLNKSMSSSVVPLNIDAATLIHTQNI